MWVQLLLNRNRITAAVILTDRQGISLIAGILHHHGNMLLRASLLQRSANWRGYRASASILTFQLTGCGLRRRSEARFSRIHRWSCLKRYNLQCNKYKTTFTWNYWYTENRNTNCISRNRIATAWAWQQDSTHPFTCSSVMTRKSRPIRAKFLYSLMLYTSLLQCCSYMSNSKHHIVFIHYVGTCRMRWFLYGLFPSFRVVQLVQLTQQLALSWPMMGIMHQIFSEICTVKPNVVADLT